MKTAKRFLKLGILAVLELGTIHGASQAESVVVSLNSPTGVDYSNLTVGQQLTFSISISGLQPGDTLTDIGANMLFENDAAGSPIVSLASYAAGPIVPSSAYYSESTFDYQFTNSSGLPYDDTYLDFDYTPHQNGPPITQNGIFTTLTVTFTQAGFGEFDLNGGQALVSEGVTYSGTNYVDFTVNPAVVPEPSSLFLTGLAIVSGLPGLARRFGRGRKS